MSFQEKLAQQRLKRDSEPVQAANDNYGSDFKSELFGIDNIKNSPACLDLRFPEGKRYAIPYSYIMEINYNPDEGIDLLTTAKQITITGRNLERLYDYLVAYRVRFIRANYGRDTGADGELYVANILIENLLNN